METVQLSFNKFTQEGRRQMTTTKREKQLQEKSLFRIGEYAYELREEAQRRSTLDKMKVKAQSVVRSPLFQKSL